MRLRMNDYDRRWNNKSRRWVYKHREIMELKIGRLLEKGEHVHHIDGDYLNNDPNNLKIESLPSHMSKHSPVYQRKFRPVKRGVQTPAAPK